MGFRGGGVKLTPPPGLQVPSRDRVKIRDFLGNNKVLQTNGYLQKEIYF